MFQSIQNLRKHSVGSLVHFIRMEKLVMFSIQRRHCQTNPVFTIKGIFFYFIEDIAEFLIRSKYGDRVTYNIGLNYLSSQRPLWYSLSDLISSKLLSGHVPRIKKALRFRPMGIQEGLNEVEILSGLTIGETIVVDGQHYLEDGQKILLIEEGRPAT